MDILRHAQEFLDQFVGLLVHLMGVLNRTGGLLFEVCCSAIPELERIVSGVPNHRRCASYHISAGAIWSNALAMYTHACFAAVSKTEIRVMTMRARDGVVAAQNRVEVKQFAQVDLCRGQRIFIDGFH